MEGDLVSCTLDDFIVYGFNGNGLNGASRGLTSLSYAFAGVRERVNMELLGILENRKDFSRGDPYYCALGKLFQDESCKTNVLFPLISTPITTDPRSKIENLSRYPALTRTYLGLVFNNLASFNR